MLLLIMMVRMMRKMMVMMIKMAIYYNNYDDETDRDYIKSLKIRSLCCHSTNSCIHNKKSYIFESYTYL